MNFKNYCKIQTLSSLFKRVDRHFLLAILLLTTLPLFAQTYSGQFNVGGTFGNYYPVIINVKGNQGEASLGKLTLYRPNVHDNTQWAGTFHAEIEFIPSVWGNMSTKFAGVKYIVGNGNVYNDPIADIIDGTTESGGSQLIIWLKGGATYYWSATNNSTVSLADANEAGTSKTSSSGQSLPVKTEQSAFILKAKNNIHYTNIGISTDNGGYFGGKVGIGTFDPKTKLDVHGNINLYGTLGMNAFDPTQCFTYDSKSIGHYSMGWYQESQCTNYGPSLLMSGYGGVKLFTMGQQRLAITAEGKVGIGFQNPDVNLANALPDEMLTVNGAIHAKEVRVDLTGSLADYVFNPDYSLMPLHKVEAFVKTNKHLPEIPSAAEVKEKGLNMGEMQNKLLQKIEELTLYVIELQKTNEKQSAKIEELEMKIK